MKIVDLGTLQYAQAWERQEQVHADVLAGREEQILLVEHPPVITLGRRPGQEPHLIASEAYLAERGVELVQSDRGGDITFHGPGQLVAYPIIRLADHGLSVGSYVHLLEKVIIDVLAELGVAACADKSAVGVWSEQDGRQAKVCAIGVRIKRGISLHGLALNVSTDLDYFNLIVPCGLSGRPVTSLKQMMGDAAPSMDRVKQLLVEKITESIPEK